MNIQDQDLMFDICQIHREPKYKTSLPKQLADIGSTCISYGATKAWGNNDCMNGPGPEVIKLFSWSNKLRMKF